MEQRQSEDQQLRVVIDAVGFVRSLINPHSAWGVVVFVHSPDYTLLVSDELEAEVRDVLDRPSLRRKYSQLSRALNLELLEFLLNAERVVLTEIPPVCRDPNDDKVVATAEQGSADFIATEDKDLLDMGSYQGIRIVTGIELLRELRRE